MPRKPNVLFIVFDDLRPQLGCYGQDWIHSPHMDALAGEGILFERAYCQQAVCAPSRASVLSGCRPDTTRIYELQTILRATLPDVVTLPQHFKNNGYETISAGKVYHHLQDDPPGWSIPPWLPRGDWKGRGYVTDEAIAAFAVTDAEQIAKGSPRRGLGPAFEAPDLDDECYHDGATAAHAIGELRRLSQLGKPFFMAVGFLKPHLPFNAPRRYWDLYDPSKLPLAANPFAPRNATQYSLLDFGELRGFFQIPKSGPIPESLARKLIHGYSACVSYSDAQMGRVLAELDRLGLHDDTVVIAWGDHGWKLGEHASWCKHSNFEIDARAPMVLHAPGRCRGARTEALVEFVDMYPTLCELCGLKIPAHCEGASMVPLLEDPNRRWKSAAFNQYPRANMTVMGYAMRTDQFRYVEWQSWPQRQVLARELYDHRVDSQENANVADELQYAAIIQHLSRQMAAGWRAARPDRAGAPGLPACPR